MKTIVLVGTLDTKGAEFAFVRDLLRATSPDLRVLTVDCGVLGEPFFPPDVSRAEVARAGGGDLDALRSGDHKDEAMRVMTAGLPVVVRRLYDEGRLDGILGMGGTGNTVVATAAMRTLPVGVPKVMVSTVGGSDVSPYAGAKDITFMPSVVDVAGLNRLSRAIYANAAGAVAGMVQARAAAAHAAATAAAAHPPGAAAAAPDKPLVVASMFGNTTQAVDTARGVLERAGYEVLVFHATGTGGRTMEGLVADGYAVGALDLTTTELADELCGGVMSAGPERCLAAPRAGVPTVLAPGCVDMANFWAKATVPARYHDRLLYEWNPNVTLLRTDAAENARMGERLAAAANAATGPVAILLPLRGVSMLDREGGAFWDPAADRACFEAVKRHVKPHVPVVELDHNVNDPEFAVRAAETLLELMRGEPPKPSTP